MCDMSKDSVIGCHINVKMTSNALILRTFFHRDFLALGKHVVFQETPLG